MHVKVMELVGESSKSFDDAVNVAVGEASRSAQNITGVEVLNMTANVSGGRITEYKANVKVAYTE